jgi:hypothetical protein
VNRRPGSGSRSRPTFPAATTSSCASFAATSCRPLTTRRPSRTRFRPSTSSSRGRIRTPSS